VTKTRRIVWIVLGSIVAISVFGAVAILVSVRIIGNRAQDPATIAAVRSSIGQFDVPAGYRVAFALDNWPIKTMMLVRSGSNAATAEYGIMLIKLMPITVPGIGPAPRSTGEASRSKWLRFAGCRRINELPDERVVARNRVFVLRHARCDDADVDEEAADATFDVSGGIVSVRGRGTRETFDLAAIRSLLRSFR
jgi:hypothetical protein